jgi:HNH endonuclease
MCRSIFQNHCISWYYSFQGISSIAFWTQSVKNNKIQQVAFNSTSTLRSHRCIFCKEDSSNSKSREHIIPESLGNDDHTLPPGIVCDSCNNYFARKVEKPLLETDYFCQLRSRQWVQNKRGKVPPLKAVFPIPAMKGNVWIDGTKMYFSGENEADTRALETAIAQGRTNQFIIPFATKPSNRLMSRFLGKIAIEVLAQRLVGIPGWESEIIDKPEFDPLRDYVRRGNKPVNWPYHERQLHHENQVHHCDGEEFQIVHEYTLLYTDKHELYLIISLFGVEFALNFGGPEIVGYERWLSLNNNQSPLYKDGKTWP